MVSLTLPLVNSSTFGVTRLDSLTAKDQLDVKQALYKARAPKVVRVLLSVLIDFAFGQLVIFWRNSSTLGFHSLTAKDLLDVKDALYNVETGLI